MTQPPMNTTRPSLLLQDQAARFLFVLGLLLLTLWPVAAQADRAQARRMTTNITGDLVLVGNMLVHCSGTGATCTNARNGVGNLDNYNSFTKAGAFALVDADGDATTTNSSSATLNMPAGSTVIWAGLYWASRYSTSTGAPAMTLAQQQLKFRTPVMPGYQTISPTTVDTNGTASSASGSSFQAFADVTALVKAGGNGTYWGADITTAVARNAWAGWSLVVIYQNPSLPFRNFAVYDGFGLIDSTTVNLTPSGFLTPLSGPVVSRLGVILWDGDRTGNTGETLLLNGTSITNAANPSGDVWNSTISDLGSNIASRNPNYLNTLGVDIDRFNVPSGVITNGATSATIGITSPGAGEVFVFGVSTFMTDLYVPIVTPNVVKTAEDMSPATPLLRGDTLRWRVTLSNTGLDGATNLVAVDNIPAYLTYVPGSLRMATGANSSPPVKTDAPYDDQAEFLTGPNRVVFRLGTGANSTQGGNLAYGESTSFYFDTTVNNDTPTGTLLTNAVQLQYNSQTLPTEVFAASSAAATANVMGPAVLSKRFVPAVIDPGQTTVLTLTVRNPANNPLSLTGVGFSDSYPAGMVNTASPNPQVTCTPGATPGTLTGGTAGGNSIGMSPAASIPPNGSCIITVNVTSSAVGSYPNTTSTVASDNGGVGSAAAATLYVGLPKISKAFAPDTINAGGTSTITFTLQSPAGTPLTQVGFSDPLAGMQVAAVPAVVGNCGGGTVTAAPGGNSIALAGGALAAGGSCTIKVNVTSNQGGAWPNTTTGVSSLEAGVAGPPSNTAELTVIGPPTIGKSFFPVSVRTATPATLTIEVTNPNSSATLTGVAFTDTYPAGLLNSSPSNVQALCTAGSSAGTVTAANGGNSLSMSGAILGAGGSCTLTVNVQSSSTGTFNNVTGAVSGSAGAGTITGDTAAATLIVANRLTVTKAFATTSIPYNNPVTPAYSASAMTLTVAANAGSTVTGVNVEDSFPAGLIVANTPAAGVSGSGCSGAVLQGRTGSGSWGAVASGNTAVRLAGASIAGGGSCVVTVNVTANSAGAYVNSTGTVYSDNGGTAAPASATLNVLGPVQVSKSFGSAAVAPGASTLLTLSVTNPSPLAVSNVVVDDLFPATPGLMTTVASGLARSCTNPASAPANTTFVLRNSANTGWDGSTASATADRRGVRIQLPSLAAGQTCTFTINVKASAAGIYDNVTGNVSSSDGGTGGTAQATLRVAVPTVAKSFNCTQPIVANSGTCTLQIDIGASSSGALSNARVIDIFPLETATGGSFTLANTTFNVSRTAGSGNCPGFSYRGRTGSSSYPDLTLPVGSLAAAAAGNTALVIQANADIPAGTTCRISATVTSATSATNIIPVGGLTGTVGGNAATNAAATQATLQVYDTPTVSKSFAAAGMPVTGSTTMTIDISQLNSTAATNVAFDDLFPASVPAGGQMVLASPLSTANSCGGTLQSRNIATGTWRTVTAGDTGLRLSGGSVPAVGNCVITANVAATQAGDYTNTISTVTTSNFGNAEAASATIKVLAAPTLAKGFTPNSIMVNEASLLTLTLTNPNATAITGASLTDTYPAGLVNTASPDASTSCAGATLTAAAGGNSLGIAGATIPANGSCTVSVLVTSATAGSYANSVPAGALTTGNAGGNAAVAAATLTVQPYMPAISLLKSVSLVSDPFNSTTSPKAIPGSVSAYTLRLTNVGLGAVDSDTIFISDDLPAEVDLFVGIGGSPTDSLQGFAFSSSSSPASGLSCTFAARNNGSDCIDFSSQPASANNFTYTPNPGPDGFDPAIRAIRFRPGGVFSAASGGNPWAEFSFRVRLR